MSFDSNSLQAAAVPLSRASRIEDPVGRPNADRRAPRVLLVAGPSAAGKSQFIDLLTKRQLPPEIWAEVPPGADRWPQFAANDCLKRGVSPESALPDKLRATGIVLHYDIAFIYRYGIEAYEKDPAATLFMHDECPVIVCVKPTSDRLVRQFVLRRERLLRKKGRARRLWAQHIRHPVQNAMARLKGARLLEATALYSDHDWLGRCYQQWDTFVRTVVRERPRTRVLYVEPCEDEASRPTFRLIERTAT